MKQIVWGCLIIALLFTGCQKKNTKEVLQPTVPATVTESVSVDPSPTTVETTPTTQVTPTKAAPIEDIPEDLQTEEDWAEFTATVVSVSPALVVTTDGFNAPDMEKLTLYCKMFSTNEERASSKYGISNLYSIDKLEPGDTLSVGTEYCLYNNKKVITKKNYCSVDLVKGVKQYDFSKESTIQEVIKKVNKEMASPTTIEYLCSPDCFAKPYQGTSSKKDDIDDFCEVMEDYTVFEIDKESLNPDLKFDMCIYLSRKANANEVMLGFNEDCFCIYQKTEVGDYQMKGAYEFYRESKLGWNELLHLFLTEQDLDQIAKEYISYEEGIDEPDTYFKGDGITSYKMHHGYQIDLDQDGVKEKVFVGSAGSKLLYTFYDHSYYIYDEMNAVVKIYINNEPCYVHNMDNTDPTAFQIVDLNPDDHMQELVILDDGPSDDYAYSFYHYANRKMTLLGSVPSYRMELEKQKDGSSLVSGDKRLSILQTWFAPSKWELTKENQIQEVDTLLYNTSSPADLKYQIRGFEEMSRDSKEIILKPQPVIFTATDDKNWLQLTLQDGSKAWIYLAEGIEFYPEDVIDTLPKNDDTTWSYQDDAIWPDQIFDGLTFYD